MFTLYFERAPIPGSIWCSTHSPPRSHDRRAYRVLTGPVSLPVCRCFVVTPCKRNGSAIIQDLHAPDVAQMYLGHQEIATTLRHYNDHDRDAVSEAAAQLASQRRGERDALVENFFKKRG